MIKDAKTINSSGQQPFPKTLAQAKSDHGL